MIVMMMRMMVNDDDYDYDFDWPCRPLTIVHHCDDYYDDNQVGTFLFNGGKTSYTINC